jgi:hypothetical protein
MPYRVGDDCFLSEMNVGHLYQTRNLAASADQRTDVCPELKNATSLNLPQA